MNLPKPTKEQNAILNSKAKTKIVISIPGSGKTTLLLLAIQKYYKNNNGNVLLISYSKKSTQENHEKIKKYCADNSKNIKVQTFDSFCNNVVTTYWKQAGYSQIPVFGNEFDHQMFKRAFDFEIENGLEIQIEFNTIKDVIAKSIQTQTSVERAIKNEEFKKERKELKKNKTSLNKIKGAYLQLRKEASKFHFNEQVIQCEGTLKEYPKILQNITNKYNLILIDEIQDLTALQLQVATYLSNSAEQTYFVGDDAQVIYQFRGVQEDNFDVLSEKVIPHKVFSLSETFRCSIPIAALATQVRSEMENVTAIEMHSNKEGIKPVFARFKNADSQYNFVANEIIRLQQQGLNYSDIAIIARLHESLCNVQRKLNDVSIHYKTKYTESENYDLLLIHKCIIGLLRLFCYEFDEKYLHDVFLFFCIECTNENYEYVKEELETKRKNPKSNGIKKLMLIGRLVHKVRKDHSLEIKAKFIIELIARQYNKSEKYYIISHLAYINKQSRNIIEVEELIACIENYNNDTKNAVSLLTSHASKGLEYKAVFVIDSNDSMFPYTHYKSECDTNAEHKLFYVSITRAADYLILTCVRNEKFKPTRFICNFKDCITLPKIKVNCSQIGKG